jgi:hypothetical protein
MNVQVRPGTAHARGGALARGSALLRAHPYRTLFVLWALQVAYLAALGLAGLPFGLDVWPMGEDRNWLRVITELPGLSFMRQFWSWDQRNPLSPWWYWLIARPMVAFDPTLYVVRKVVELLLAVSLTAALARLLDRRDGGLPLAGGALVLACCFNYYTEQIVWNFLVGLALGLAAVACFARYVARNRQDGHALGAALVLLFVCIATYSLYLGLAGALVALALAGRGSSPVRWRQRFADAVLVGAIAVIFVAIWYTASPLSGGRFHMDPGLLRANLLASVRNVVWHTDFHNWLAAGWSGTNVLVAMPLALVYGAFVLAVCRGAAGHQPVRGADIGWLATLLLAIAAPVVILESTTRAWYPGSRSRMVYEVTAPLLLLLAVAVATFLVQRSGRGRLAAVAVPWILALATLALVPAAVAYNRALVAQTAEQRHFAAELRRVVDTHPEASVFLVRYAYDPQREWRTVNPGDTYAKTLLGRNDVTMRLIPYAGTRHDAEWRWWRLQLLPDDTGVGGARAGDEKAVPYAQLLFVAYDGQRMSVPRQVDAAFFDGLDVDWRRSTPILQNRQVRFTCPVTFDFSTRARGEGWSVPERRPDGSHAMWMARPHAWLALPSSCAGRVQMRLSIAGTMAADILDGLHVRVDGEPATLRRVEAPGRDPTLVASVPLRPGEHWVRVDFDAPRTIVPVGGQRTLAVMFSGIELAP